MRAQFIVLVTSRVLASALQAAMFLWLARLVGPEEFGPVGVAFGACSVGFAFADMGLSSYIAKLRAMGTAAEVRAALRLNVLSTSVAIVAGVLILVASGSSLWLAGLVLALGLEKNQDTSLGIFVADGAQGVAARAVLMRRCAALVTFSLASWIAPVPAYCFAILVGAVISSVYTYQRVSFAVPASKGGPGLATTSLRSLPYLIGNVSTQSRMLDSVIVATFVSVAAAGLYAAPQRIVNAAMIIPGALSSLLLPRSSKAEPVAALVMARRLFVLLLVLTLAIAAILPFSGEIVVALFGEEFQGGAVVMAWMLLGLPAIALSSPMGAVLQGQDRQNFVAGNGVIAAVATLGGVAFAASVDSLQAVSAVGSIVFLLKCVSLYAYSECMLIRRARGGESA